MRWQSVSMGYVKIGPSVERESYPKIYVVVWQVNELYGALVMRAILIEGTICIF